MAINIKLETSNKKGKDFPKLMKYNLKGGSFIVLFTKEKHGTVLQSNCSDWVVGETCDDFAMIAFIDYEGEITLSNK